MACRFGTASATCVPSTAADRIGSGAAAFSRRLRSRQWSGGFQPPSVVATESRQSHGDKDVAAPLSRNGEAGERRFSSRLVWG